MAVAKLRWFVYSAAVAASTALAWTASTVAVRGADATPLLADALTCDMSQYKSSSGPIATIDQNVLTVGWPGQSGSEMRARYAIDSARPIVRDLSVRKTGGQWVTLGQNVTPEYQVVSGIRSMSSPRAGPPQAAGMQRHSDVI